MIEKILSIAEPIYATTSPLIFILIYGLLITGTGLTVTKYFTKHSFEQLIASYICGSVIIGLIMFFCSHLHLINTPMISALLMIILILSLINIKPFYASVKNSWPFINDYVIKHDRWRKPYIFTLVILILWMTLMSLTPARKADAMRYHLAQVRDIALHHGYVFRPYVHFHFPIYFGLLFMPMYFVAKGVGIKVSVFLNFILSQLVLQRLAQKIGVTFNRLLLFLLYLTPLGFDFGHSAMLGWPIIFYLLSGALMILAFENEKKYSFLVLGFMALGFICGIKYQAIALIPWFCYLAYKKLDGNRYKYRLLSTLLVIGLLVASPFYIRNLVEFHNPFWPLLSHLFPGKNAALNRLANIFSSSMQPKHTLGGIWTDIKTFAFSPRIPATFWLLGILGLLFTKTTRLHIKAGIILFFSIAWAAQSTIRIKLSLYILPMVLIAVVQLITHLANTQKKWCLYSCYTILCITLSYSLYIATIYSPFYLRYIFTHNEKQYHKYTWYYNNYAWMEKHLPKNARVLAMAEGGETYYLNENYVRSDNESSLIDWAKIKTSKQLDDKLNQLKIKYIFYSSNSTNAVPTNKFLLYIKNIRHKIIYSNKETVYTSRIKQLSRKDQVYIVKLE
ncbi:MAG: hypothetical protein K0U29_01025 [Gammaproteobacteria bacterium]|nr:hypothetical protein [Gammaproteobacteria bacterium]